MFTLEFDSTGGSKTVQYNFNTTGKQCEEKPSFNTSGDWITVTPGTGSITIAVSVSGAYRDGYVNVKVGDTDCTNTDGGENISPHRRIKIVQHAPTS